MWEPEDASALVTLCKRPGIAEFSSPTYQNVSIEKAQAFITKETQRFRTLGAAKFAVCLKTTGELIGISGIFEKDTPHSGQFEINYRFCSDHWGKGYGTEAAKAMVEFGFTRLHLNRVYAVVRIENIQSAKVLTNVGMTIESDFIWNDMPAKLWSISRPR